MFSDWITLETRELKVAIEAEGARSGSRRDKGVAQVKLFQQKLDLGHNIISTAAAARALILNCSLKILRLEGNPVAEHARYRPALTCLLPHVLNIDSRSMPPSFHRERRGPVGFSRNGTV